MKQTVSLKLIMGVLLVLLCLIVGCKRGDTDIITASPANGPTVGAVSKTAEQMLTEGSDIDVILSALEDQLKADPRVFDVVLESENGSVSAVFVDGETHTFTLVDEEKQSDDGSYSSIDLAYDPESASQVIENDELEPFQQQVPLGGVYRMPANNKALLANSVNYFDASKDTFVVTDSTELIHTMLKARGYEVNHATESLMPPGYEPVNQDLTIDLFNNLTQYGVIVIETHSGRRALEYPTELLGKENCGGYYSSFRIVTTELVTESKIMQYMKDIFCGRVSFQDRYSKLKNGKKILKDQFFVVTPNYIREHDKGTFPDNTLMLLSACSSYLDDKKSPMKDLLFEKCNKGARFLGWTGKVSARIAIRAGLNLFQLMTASNEELTGKKDFIALKKSTPPQGGWFTPLTRALEELDKKSYLTDPNNGAKLQLSSQSGEDFDLTLMPHPLIAYWPWDWWNGCLAQLWMYTDSQPKVTIGETEVAVTKSGDTDTWALSQVPVGAYGDIVVRENGRTSISRPLHRWKTQIKVTSISSPENFPGIKYDVTFTLQARSTIGLYIPEVVTRDCFRDSIWNDPPPAQFAAWWDVTASNVAYKIEGEGYSGDQHFKYSGSGLKPLIETYPPDTKDGILTDESGTSVTLKIRVLLPFTMTIENGSTKTFETAFPIIIEKDGIALSDDWGVFPASFQSDMLLPGGMAQISWNAFAADPPFDMDNEPR
jgi:hypothetical protein